MISVGFLLIKPVVRPPYVSAELIPELVISASNCICPQFPGPYAISWCSESDEDRVARLTEVGVPAELHAIAIQWATAAFGETYGWPGVFYSVEAAREARDRFIASPEFVKVIALGLPEQFAEDFMKRAAPTASPPGYAPSGESGYLECIKRRDALPDGGRHLGFELLNLQVGMLEDSWLCNGLEQHCATTLQIRPTHNGLLATLEDATRSCAEIDREEVGAEPGPWYPFQLVEY
ncbi:MAG TPA: hypothetical protein VGQ76_15300 [Thermoanaerobaculia bacterium]|jgi:hypothetical protein|nr:hypothetical protein [Thermoanaerobaculia bacterium]